jgi:hypothetical protein
MFSLRPQLAVPIFMGAAVMLLAYMSAAKSQQRTGIASPPNYLKVFLITVSGTYAVMYFVCKQAGGGNSSSTSTGGADLTIEQLLSRIDMKEPQF